MTAAAFSAVDLSALPPPDVVEALDYEAILAALVEDFRARWPDFSAALESEPAVKLLEVAAYREVLLRERINDAARACMLATARGADLEHLAALYGVQRLVVTPADPTANPPVAEVRETDAALRARTQLAPEAWTTAGSVGAYRFHALSAAAEVVDVDVFAPTTAAGNLRGEVVVTLLSSAADGQPSAEALAAVAAALSADTVRPLTDRVLVRAPANVSAYNVVAALGIASGPSPAAVVEAAEAAVAAYVASRRRLGAAVLLSGIYAALHQPGVAEVALSEPIADIRPAHDAVAICAGISISQAAG